MKKYNVIITIDIIAFLLNDLVGWFLSIAFDSTGYDCLFADLKLHLILLVIGFVHLALSIIFNVYLYKKERTKYRIQIGKGLFAYNLTMTIIPYLYVGIVSF